MKRINQLGMVLCVVTSVSATGALADNALATSFDWTGYYLGVDIGSSAGNGFVQEQTCLTNPACAGPIFQDIDDTSVVFGGRLSALKQLDSGLVLGALLGVGNGGSYSGPTVYGHGVDPTSIATLDFGLTGTARVELGYAMGRFLPYVDAGVVASRAQASLDQSGPNYAPADTKTAYGWTVGVGMKYAPTDLLVLGVEYNYRKYGSTPLAAYDAVNDNTAICGSDLEMHDIKATLELKY